MTERDEAAPHGDTGAHASALSAAVLRVGASLDLDTVLEKMVATALAGAGCGTIATVHASMRRCVEAARRLRHLGAHRGRAPRCGFRAKVITDSDAK